MLYGLYFKTFQFWGKLTVQGEQVGILWNNLFCQYNIKIHFAHRTFNWKNEAKGNAAVHCVIIGFSAYDVSKKIIYEYQDINGDATSNIVKNISPYLIEGKDFALISRNKPLCFVPELIFGNMANDGGHLILQNEDEYTNYANNEPAGIKFIRPFVGSVELINNIKRYCFWLVGINPSELKTLKLLNDRIESVRAFRLNSTREATRKLASFPYLFGEIRQKTGNILVIPRVSSENRNYVPIAFYNYKTIINDRCTFMNDASLYNFGVITSKMHMVWMKTTCGRLKSDFNYSNNIVYNNYPWPENPSEKHIKIIEEKAQTVLDVRASFPTSSLADLYNPLTMPPALVKAHNELDKAVDLAYRSQPFTSDANRMEFLFELYEKYTGGLFAEEKKSKLKKK
ncbi:MAG: type IIL restriction-modification enzyme MmeI [Moraxellaceae bacterium]